MTDNNNTEGPTLERGECPKCGGESMELVDVGGITVGSLSDYERACGLCIKKHGQNVYRKNERRKRRRGDVYKENWW